MEFGATSLGFAILSFGEIKLSEKASPVIRVSSFGIGYKSYLKCFGITFSNLFFSINLP